MTVDPFNITKYERTEAELEEFLLFCVAVCGHQASSTSKALDKFLSYKLEHDSPFNHVRRILDRPMEPFNGEGPAEYGIRIFNNWRKIKRALGEAGIGCKTKVGRSFWELVYSGLNLRTCTVEDLEKIYGIGMKTSRFFIMHSRKDINNVAVLDVHVLRWLAGLGYKVPRSTPASKSQYLKLEKIFLTHAHQSGKSVAEFDLEIWKKGAA